VSDSAVPDGAAPVALRSQYAWFGALCDDDYEQLGVVDPTLVSSYEHCADIVLAAQQCGFDNILLPSGYALGIDPVAFAAAMAPQLDRLSLLVAVRAGELHVAQLARQLATLHQLLRGRLTINIISSDLPGESLASEPRYQRTREVMLALRALLAGESIDHRGQFINLQLDAPRIAREHPCRAPFYFGGLSEPARSVAAECADVYLMWPDTMPSVQALIEDMRARALAHGRTLRFGYRVHVIVRETQAAAQAAARHVVGALDPSVGEAIRKRSLDSGSVGVARQSELRADADNDGYVEECLWTGIGAGRSGCGAAIVGDPGQVIAKLRAYEALGIDTFILSGYPHEREAKRFAELVLARLR
jgi:alkanesulfonate monooxygenase